MQTGGLRVGDRIRTADELDVAVAALRYNTGTAHVYALTVANDHDFFESAARVLMHNSVPCLSHRLRGDFGHNTS